MQLFYQRCPDCESDPKYRGFHGYVIVLHQSQQMGPAIHIPLRETLRIAFRQLELGTKRWNIPRGEIFRIKSEIEKDKTALVMNKYSAVPAPAHPALAIMDAPIEERREAHGLADPVGDRRLSTVF